MAILDRAGHLRTRPELCPHSGTRATAAILVHGWRRDMVLCPLCLRSFQELTVGYLGGELGPREVVARMRALGYTRADAARIVLELAARKLGVRLGFARRAT